MKPEVEERIPDKHLDGALERIQEGGRRRSVLAETPREALQQLHPPQQHEQLSPSGGG